jgi:hypothetical protein
MKVFLYRNLHKEGFCYSIKAVDGPHKGKVLGYSRKVIVENAAYKVSEAGRQRVLRTKKKNVHAGVVGDLKIVGSDVIERIPGSLALYSLPMHITIKKINDVTYNPYKYSSFVIRQTEEPIQTSKWALLDNEKVKAIN